MSCITCVSLLPVISLMAADRYDPMLDFTSSQISWLFRLDPHLAFTSYSVRQYKGETGSHRHKHCAVPEEKLSFCFTSYCMGNDLLMEYINPPLTPKQCLPLSEEHTPGKGEEKASTGARHGPRPCGVLRPLEALALPGLALCPGPASLPESTPAESKEFFFFFPPSPKRYQRRGWGAKPAPGLGFPHPLAPVPATSREFGKSHVSQESPRNSSSSPIWPYVSYRLIISSQMKPSLWLRTQTARFLNFNYGVKIKIW